MTDHRRRAEDALERYFDKEVQTECGCSACTTTTYKFRERAEYQDLVDSFASALKEVEEETFARAEKAIQACDPMARGESLIFQTLLDALCEEAAKK